MKIQNLKLATIFSKEALKLMPPYDDRYLTLEELDRLYSGFLAAVMGAPYQDPDLLFEPSEMIVFVPTENWYRLGFLAGCVFRERTRGRWN